MTSILRASDAPADRDLERIATAISADAAKTPIQVVRELRSLSIPDLALRHECRHHHQTGGRVSARPGAPGLGRQRVRCAG
jgi:hypothetical protein